MNTFKEAILDELTLTTTENGAITNSTSSDTHVNLFFMIGAKRGASYEEIVEIFEPAFEEDPDLAFRIALWVRDVREGAGERQTFRHILRYFLETDNYHFISRSFDAIRDLGRLDDLFVYLDGGSFVRTLTVNFIMEELHKNNGLMAKWIPRKGKYNNIIRSHINLSARDFRKWIVSLTNVVETKMCENKWDEIEYSKVPSVAMSRYNMAFRRHDDSGFTSFLNRVNNKEVNPKTGKIEKINTGALFPYDLIKGFNQYSKPDNIDAIQTQWDNLPDFVPEGLSFLPIIDLSSSMTTSVGSTTCMQVAISLGLYLAERNKGDFKDIWLNFSDNPVFRKITGDNIWEKIKNLDYSDWGGSTNLEAAMEKIIDLALENNTPQHELPEYLLVLSDMEFNSWGNKPVGKQTKKLFEDNGYKMPNIIWWNIQARGNSNIPVKYSDDGMALVSGLSPAIVKNILAGEITPYNIMIKTVMNDRYNY